MKTRKPLPVLDEVRDFAELKPFPRNPRTITDAQMDMLRASLKAFGDLGGLVFNRRTKHLVGGHQRVEAFKRDGASAKVIILERNKKPDADGTIAWGFVHSGASRYFYREVDWTEDQEIAANLAANKHGGEFIPEQVTELLNELDGKIDLSLTGFSNEEILALMEGLHTPLQIEEIVEPSEALNFVIRCKNMAEMNRLQQRIGLDGTRTDYAIFIKQWDANRKGALENAESEENDSAE
jgi:hypothetical protein